MSKKVGRVELFDISITFLISSVATSRLVVDTEMVKRHQMSILPVRRFHEISGEHYGQRECSQKTEKNVGISLEFLDHKLPL